MKILRTFMCVAALSAGLCVPAVQAQPSASSQPMEFVVGFPAGGGVDTVARAIAQHVQQHSGKTVVVENRAGAGSKIAAEHVKGVRGDGPATVFITPESIMTLYPSTNKTLRYDPIADFKPIGTLVDVQSAFFVNADLPVRNMQEYKAWVMADKTNRSTLGSPADGSMPHFLGTSILHSLGLPVTPVPYKGTAPMVTDVLGGHIPAAVNPIADVIEYHRSGKLRILAVGGASRSPLLPDVPTFQEVGLKVVGGQEWYGAFVPRSTTPEKQRELVRQIQAALQDPAITRLFAERGWNVNFRGPDQLAGLVEKGTANWRTVIRDLNYQPQ